MPVSDQRLPPFGRANHIAIVMHDFSNGGTERIAIRLGNHWARTGRRVSILCGTPDGPARARVDPAITVIAAHPQIRRSRLSRFALGRALAACVGAIEPDLLFVPGNFHIPVIATLASRLGENRPAIICKLSNPLRRPYRPAALQWLFGTIVRRMTGAVDGFVAMSAALADEAREVLHRSEVRRIYEPNIDGSYRPPPGDGERDGRTILCAGRLVPQKDFEMAIQAFARIDPAFGAHLLILGDGETRLRLEILVDRLGINDRVTFGGHVPDIRPALARASLFLLSSRYEGYPAVLIEALAAGVPVVATDCSPAIREIMSDPSFGTVVPADPARLADAMESLLRRPYQQVDATRLIERHRADAVGDRYLALFDLTVRGRQERERTT